MIINRMLRDVFVSQAAAPTLCVLPPQQHVMPSILCRLILLSIFSPRRTFRNRSLPQGPLQGHEPQDRHYKASNKIFLPQGTKYQMVDLLSFAPKVPSSSFSHTFLGAQFSCTYLVFIHCFSSLFLRLVILKHFFAVPS